MSSEGIMNFLSLNRSLTNMGDESRHFRLPRMNPFPKLDGRIVREHPPCAALRVAARCAWGSDYRRASLVRCQKWRLM